MKCSKCGEECNEKQSFCMKCGNPIEIVPDLNLIEEELANNIGELMDEEETEDRSRTKIISGIDTEDDYLRDITADISDDMNIPDIHDDGLELIEIAREHSARKQSEEFQVDSVKANQAANKAAMAEKSAKDKKMKKIKIGIICGLVAVLIVVAVIVAVMMQGIGGKSKDSFAEIYNKGVDYYSERDFDNAIDSFQNAINLADTDELKIKANKSLYDTYMKKGIKTLSDSEIEECIDLLKTLIELDGDNEEYYSELISLYTRKDMQKELDELKSSLAGTAMGEKLNISSIGTPVISVESGEYDKYLTVEITNESGTKAYYTLDGSAPDKNSTLYEGPIEIKQQGNIVLQAVAVDEEDNASEIAKAEYTIKLESIDAPVVSPSSGTYTEAQQITVEVPDGMKAYYTIDAYGKTPDTESEEYTEPIDMPRGKNVFSVILVDESGMSSDITENIYQYNVDRNYSYDEALTNLKDFLVDQEVIEDVSGAMKDNSVMEFSYKEIAIVDNNEYYLIECTYKSSSNKIIDTYIYGVDTVKGNVDRISTDADGKYKLN